VCSAACPAGSFGLPPVLKAQVLPEQAGGVLLLLVEQSGVKHAVCVVPEPVVPAQLMRVAARTMLRAQGVKSVKRLAFDLFVILRSPG
jgi:hypothetical protein